MYGLKERWGAVEVEDRGDDLIAWFTVNGSVIRACHALAEIGVRSERVAELDKPYAPTGWLMLAVRVEKPPVIAGCR